MNTLKLYITVVVLGVSVLAGAANPDIWTGNKKPTFLQNWTFNASTGFTSFFGDLSYYDNDVFGKLKYESKQSYSGMVIKHFGAAFGLGAQVMFGGFCNESSNSMSFKTRIFEYNLQFRINAIRLLKGYDTKFGIIGFLGMGQFISKTEMILDAEGVREGFKRQTGVPEFVYFFGGGVTYRVSPRISIMSELSIRQAQNDMLDNYLASNNYDYYSHLSIGICYHIKNLFMFSKEKYYLTKLVRTVYR